MFYDFPVGLSLDEVRRVVREHNARLDMNCFIEKDCGDHIIFNYLISTKDSWPEPGADHGIPDRDCTILRECRGLIFSKDGKILARRYHKFFNVNEKPWTQSHLIEWSTSHVVLDKMDGSMVTPYYSNGEIVWGSKMGRTDVSTQVSAYVATRPQYDEIARYCFGRNWTPIFEWMSRKQKIVIDYGADDVLMLMAIRKNWDGSYLRF